MQIIYSTRVQQQVAKANSRANLASAKSDLCHKQEQIWFSSQVWSNCPGRFVFSASKPTLWLSCIGCRLFTWPSSQVFSLKNLYGSSQTFLSIWGQSCTGNESGNQEEQVDCHSVTGWIQIFNSLGMQKKVHCFPAQDTRQQQQKWPL